MNQYGQQARAYWQRWLPEQYMELTDPEEHFVRLGLKIAERVDELWKSLVVSDEAPADETEPERASRLKSLKLAAEEYVFAELDFPPPEPGAGADDSGMESDEEFTDRLNDFDAIQTWRAETSDALLDGRMTLDDLSDAQLQHLVEYLTPDFLLVFGTSVDELRAQGRRI